MRHKLVLSTKSGSSMSYGTSKHTGKTKDNGCFVLLLLFCSVCFGQVCYVFVVLFMFWRLRFSSDADNVRLTMFVLLLFANLVH